MRYCVVAALLLVAVAALAGPGSRSAREYLVDRPGTAWHYDGPLGPAEVVTVTARDADGRIRVLDRDQNNAQSTRSWRLVDGAWTEQFDARGPKPVVILPARLQVGTRWSFTYRDLLGHTGTHQFEVMALSEKVTLKNGVVEVDCLRVHEIRPDLGPDLPVVHWFAPKRGEVAAKVGESWFRSLSKFEPGRK